MEEKKTRDLLSLASIPLVMTLGNSMLIPVIPTIENELNISNIQSSMIITVYSIVSIVLIPFAGYLSDKLGRKKVIIPSLAIAGVGGIISGFAAWKMQNPYWLILAGRLVQGAGSSGAFPVVMPTVGDMFNNESDVSRGLGIIETANTFGKVLSPVLGSLFAAWIWFIPFWAIPVFTAISIVLVAIFVKVPEKEQAGNNQRLKEFVSQVRDIIKKNSRWLYTIFFLGLVSMFVYFGSLFYFSSSLEDKFGIQGIIRGLYIAVPLLALCVTSFITGKTIGQHKTLMKWIIFAGFLISAASLAGIIFIEHLTMMIAVLSVVNIGIGAALPSIDALITEGVEKEHRGTITCIYSSMRLLGVALGPPAIALLLKSTKTITFLSLAIIAVAAALTNLFFIKPAKKK
ncbi:MAG: MFS transporter [Acetivibrionales bacterium]|jgi:ACDE family multidrug resistance protein